MTTPPLVLDVFSDIACPWCFIGKRRLAQAIAEDGGAFEVRWHAYQLAPDLPPEGVEAKPWFAKKFGSMERIRAMWPRVVGLGREAGIAFDFEGQERAPNTRLGHRVIQLAQAQGKGSEAKDALFSGHFSEAKDVAKLEVICELLAAHQVGLDLEKLRADLADGGGDEEVDADLALARQLGISGVPFFIANGRVGLSGAQDVATFRRYFAEARQRTAA